MKRLFFIAALCIFSQSCSIDNNLNPPCSEPGGWGYATIVSPENKPYRNAPSSNPLNFYEFAYIALDNGIEGYWKYDLLSNTKKLIKEIDADEPLDWNIKDWIVFGSNAQIYICKSNGDSLMQLTFENYNYDPSWSPDGEYIIFKSTVSNFRVINRLGHHFKDYNSTIYAGNSSSWSPDGEKIAFISTSNEFNKSLIAYFEISTPEDIHYINGTDIKFNGSALLGPLDWYPDSKRLLYNYNNDIYLANIETGDIQLVKEGVDCISYNYHTILTDGETIISVKQESSYDSKTNTEFHDYDLIQINPDGSVFTLPY